MFANSERLVGECGLTYLHVFPFSRRPGTPAARMPQLAGNLVRARAARLREVGRSALAGHLASQVGSTAEILMERDGLGRTPGFAEMVLDAEVQTGEIVQARVTASDGRRLQGALLAPKCAA
jgi:threonylcarbamoyladenosine tRNA methylthiotransferase MtaB